MLSAPPDFGSGSSCSHSLSKANLLSPPVGQLLPSQHLFLGLNSCLSPPSLSLSLWSLQFSFISHAAWQFLPRSHCLVWSLWFPPTTLTLVSPLFSKKTHNISQLPVHPLILHLCGLGMLACWQWARRWTSLYFGSLKNACQSHLEKINISASVVYCGSSSDFT